MDLSSDYVENTGPVVRVGVIAEPDTPEDQVVAFAQDHIGSDHWPDSVVPNPHGFEVTFERYP